jgi:type IV pilus assembly protein PilC
MERPAYSLSRRNLRSLNNRLLLLVRGGFGIEAALGNAASTIGNKPITGACGVWQTDLAHATEDSLPSSGIFALYRVLFLKAPRGHWADFLASSQEYLDEQHALRTKLLLSLIAPLLIGTLLIGLASYGLLLLNFFNFIGDMFGTRNAVAIVGAVFVEHAKPIAATMAVLFSAVWLQVLALLFAASAGRYIDFVRMNVPMFGRIYVIVSTERLNSILRLLLLNGLPIEPSLKCAARFSGNALFVRAIDRALSRFGAGMPLSGALARERIHNSKLVLAVAEAAARGEAKSVAPLLSSGAGSTISIELGLTFESLGVAAGSMAFVAIGLPLFASMLGRIGGG